MTCKNQYSFEPVEMEYRIFDFEKLNKIKFLPSLFIFLRPTMLLFKKRRRLLYDMEQNHKNRRTLITKKHCIPSTVTQFLSFS